MRYSILLLIACAGILTAPHAIAQVDPDTSGVGIYFEPSADTNLLVIDPGPTVHTAYVCATNLPEMPHYQHYCFHLVFEDEPGCLEIVEYVYPYGADNLRSPPDFLVSNFINFIWQPSIVLLEIRFTVSCPDEVRFYIEPFININLSVLQVWLEIGGEESLTPSSGRSDEAVAVINGLQPIPTESTTWSALHALYR